MIELSMRPPTALVPFTPGVSDTLDNTGRRSGICCFCFWKSEVRKERERRKCTVYMSVQDFGMNVQYQKYKVDVKVLKQMREKAQNLSVMVGIADHGGVGTGGHQAMRWPICGSTT